MLAAPGHISLCGQKTCIACASGYYTTAGTTSNTACGNVQSVEPGQQVVCLSDCSICIAGKFQSSPGSSSCISCVSGFWSTVGATKCTVCAVGRHLVEFQAAHQLVNACHVQQANFKISQDRGSAVTARRTVCCCSAAKNCSVCPAGRSSNPGSKMLNSCSTCDIGRFSSAGAEAAHCARLTVPT